MSVPSKRQQRVTYRLLGKLKTNLRPASGVQDNTVLVIFDSRFRQTHGIAIHYLNAASKSTLPHIENMDITWKDRRIVVSSPFKTWQMSASSSLVDVSDSLRSDHHSTTELLAHLLVERGCQAGRLTSRYVNRVYSGNVGRLGNSLHKSTMIRGTNVDNAVGSTVSSPALTKPETTAPTPGTLKISSTN